VLYELLVGVSPFYTDNIKKLYSSIQSAKLPLPSFLSREVMDLLARMLSKNPVSRITIPNVKQHPYFKDIDWELLAQKKINPPILLTTDQDKNQGLDEEDAFLKMDKKQIINHNDNDYNDANKTLNRVK